MTCSRRQVFASPEAYRRGWARGFYGAHMPETNAAAQLDDILRHGVRGEADGQFLAGYREGRVERGRQLLAL